MTERPVVQNKSGPLEQSLPRASIGVAVALRDRAVIDDVLPLPSKWLQAGAQAGLVAMCWCA
jgi:hypothetical protein